jgi:hypothetical protein
VVVVMVKKKQKKRPKTIKKSKQLNI